MPTSPHPSALNRMAPLSILRMLWNRKLLIVVIWGVVSAGVYLWVRRLPSVYSAQATVVVDSQKIPDRYVSSTVNTDLQDRLANISQQILSSTRLQKIIEEFGLYREERRTLPMEDVVEKMRKAITIEAEVKAFSGSRVGAFKVGFQGTDAGVVAAVANRISNLYVEENLRTREVDAQGTEEFIESQLQDAKKTLDGLEAAVSKYKLAHNGELPQQESQISATLARLQVALEANRDALDRAQQTKVTLENSLEIAQANLAAVTAAMQASPAAGSVTVASGGVAVPVAPARPRPLSEQIQAQIDALSARYEPMHPEMRRLRAELALAKEEEAKEARAERANAAAAASAAADKPAPPKGVNAASGQAAAAEAGAARLAAINNNLQMAQARERVNSVKTQIQFAEKEIQERQGDQREILRQIDSYQAKLQRLPIREQEMAQLTRDYEIAKANYKSLLDKRLSAGMATAMEHREKSERFEVIDPAQVPVKPSKPNRPVLYGSGSVLGLVFGLVLAAGLEARKDVVLGAWELPARLPVLGSVPRIDTEFLAAEPAAPRASGKRMRLVIFCSVTLSLVTALAAGAYLMMHRW